MYADLSMGLRSIASKLNDEKIPSPGCANPKSNLDFTWCLSSVRGILQNPVYTGDLTWNRTTQAKFHRIANGQAQKRETVRRVIDKNGRQDWIVVPGAHEPLVSRSLLERAFSRRSSESRTKDNFRRGQGKDSPFLLTGLLVCRHCGFKIQGHTRNTGYHRVDGDETLSFSYICGGYRSKGRTVCKRYYLRRDPFETFILGRVEKRLHKYLAQGGMTLLREFITEELTSKVKDPQEEIGRIRTDLARLQAEADRLLDVMTPATADFVGERLGKVRVERRLSGPDWVTWSASTTAPST